MKRVITSILIVCILISAFSFNVTAEENNGEPYLEIMGYNVVVGNAIYLAYAVFADNLPENSNVELLIWDKPQSKYEKGTERIALYATTGRAVIDGKECAVYVFKDIQNSGNLYGMKTVEMATEFYSVAYLPLIDGGVYSKVTKYSLVEYVYNKIGKIGDAPTTDEDYIRYLLAILEYGASAHDLLGDKNPRRPDKEYYQVFVTGGTLLDGFSEGIYYQGEKITVTAPLWDGDKIFSHWIDQTGRVVGTSLVSEITVKAETSTYTPVYKEVTD